MVCLQALYRGRLEVARIALPWVVIAAGVTGVLQLGNQQPMTLLAAVTPAAATAACKHCCAYIPDINMIVVKILSATLVASMHDQ